MFQEYMDSKFMDKEDRNLRNKRKLNIVLIMEKKLKFEYVNYLINIINKQIKLI